MPLILNGTTGVSGVDGTTGTPAVRGGDANTGVVFGTDTISLVEGGVSALSIDSNANASLVGTLAMGSSFLRNRIINGGMRLDQRNAGASQTITAAAALAYTVDRWYAYCTGANVTGQQVSSTGTTDSPAQNAYRFTGAASVTAIGFGQRIEAVNCFDLAGQTATLSVNLANSVLTTVTWTAFYANTTDTFGTLASPTVTQIATGTFTVNSTLTRYTTNISIPSAATTGIQIVFTVGAQTSGTWTIGNVQLERGSVATPFERRQYGQELMLCQRYYQSYVNGAVLRGVIVGSSASRVGMVLSVVMRSLPTMSVVGVINVFDGSGTTTWSGTPISYSTAQQLEFDAPLAGALNTGRPACCFLAAGNALNLSSEL